MVDSFGGVGWCRAPLEQLWHLLSHVLGAPVAMDGGGIPGTLEMQVP